MASVTELAFSVSTVYDFDPYDEEEREDDALLTTYDDALCIRKALIIRPGLPRKHIDAMIIRNTLL